MQPVIRERIDGDAGLGDTMTTPPAPSPPDGPPPGYAPNLHADPASGPRVNVPGYPDPSAFGGSATAGGPPLGVFAQGNPMPAAMAQGYPQPAFDAPQSHTVAMEAPPVGAFQQYAGPGAPMQGMPGAMQPQPWAQYPMQGPPQQMQYPQPQPPTAQSSVGGSGWLVGLVVVALAATAGGYVVMRARRTSITTPTRSTPVATTTVHPAPVVVPVAAPTLPTVADASQALAAAQDGAASALVAALATDVPAVASTDAGAVIEAAAEPVVAAEIDAGTPVAAPESPPATAPRPHASTVARTVARPVARTVAAHPASGDAGTSSSPLNDAMRRQDWAEARRLLNAELRTRPNDAAGHAQLGYVCDRLGDSRAALNEYRAATRSDRRNTRYLHRLADLQIATGDRPGAVATIQQILRINPSEPAAHARLEQMQAGH